MLYWLEEEVGELSPEQAEMAIKMLKAELWVDQSISSEEVDLVIRFYRTFDRVRSLAPSCARLALRFKPTELSKRAERDA